MKNKFLKKVINLFGYKLIEKKLVKNNRILSKNAVLNLRLILSNIFEKNNIKNLVQIGANDGISFDELNYFIKKNKVKSVLVEPIIENFLNLKNNYKNCDFIIFENSAISSHQKMYHLYKVDTKFAKNYGNHIPAIPSFDKNHLIKHGVKNSHIVKEKVNSITIKDLINKYKIINLDLFFVDAEGYDGNIVTDLLNDTNLRPIIIFEYIHIDNITFQNLLNLLTKKNFFYFNISECLIVFPEEKKIQISF
jgi:FkbM family methyltransferase